MSIVMRDAPQILWGPNLENGLKFGYPPEGAVARRAAREGYRSVQARDGSAEDAAVYGRDYELSCGLRWVEEKDRAGSFPATGWSGATGVQAFLAWARDKRRFRFCPSQQTPDFWVDGCYLVDPIEEEPSLESDGTRRIDVTMRSPYMDFGWALRGVAVELGPGFLPGVGSRPRLESQNSIGTYHTRAGRVASGVANSPRTRHHYPRYDRNDVLHSEALDNAVWSKVNTTITANNTTAPDGQSTADKVLETTAPGNHYINEQITIVAGEYLFASFHVKAAERNRVIVRCSDAGSTTGFQVNDLNLTTGAVASIASFGTGTLVSGRVVRLDDGWWRVELVGRIDVATTTTAVLFVFIGDANGSYSYTGVATNGIYAWGGQIGRANSTVSPPPVMGYVRTTTTPLTRALTPVQAWLHGSAGANEAQWSEELNRTGGAPWNAANLTVGTDQTPAPDDTTTAERLTEASDVSQPHYLFQIITITAGEYLYISCFAKANTRTRFRLGVWDAATNLNGFQVRYNLVTGALIDATAFGATAQLKWHRATALGNGWYRIEASGRIDSGTVTSVHLSLQLVNDSNLNTYDGDGTSNLYAWGGQLVRTQSTLTPALAFAYRKTTTTVSVLAVDVFELDWPWPMQTMWGYMKFIEEGEALRAGFADFLRLGQVAASLPLIRVLTGAATAGANPFWRFNWSHDGGTTQSGALATTTPFPGDTVELFFRILSDGSVELQQSINGAAVTIHTSSGAVAPSTAHNLGRRLRLAGAHVGLINLKLGFAPWITTISRARHA